MNSTTYKTFRNIDGVHWLSLEPMIADLRVLFDTLEDNSAAQQQTAVVLMFLNSILVEAQMADIVAPDNSELSYHETLLQ